VQLHPDFAQARQRLMELDNPPPPAQRPPVPPVEKRPSPERRPPAPPPVGPARPSTRGAIVGQARQIERRQNVDPWTRDNIDRWSLRVERTDEAGNPLRPVTVVVEGARMVGSIHEGDWVEVKGRWHPGRPLRATAIRNLSTDETVRPRNVGRYLIIIMVVLFVIGFIVALVWGINSAQNWQDDFSPSATYTSAVQAP
jgi:hypothetical protein